MVNCSTNPGVSSCPTVLWDELDCRWDFKMSYIMCPISCVPSADIPHAVSSCLTVPWTVPEVLNCPTLKYTIFLRSDTVATFLFAVHFSAATT